MILSDDELALYELAFHLKIPVYKLQHEMPYEEFQMWYRYLEERPVDWRDDERIYKVLQTQGVKEKPYKIFPSLQLLQDSITRRKSKQEGLNVDSLKRSTMFHKMLSAKGGAKLNLDSGGGDAEK